MASGASKRLGLLGRSLSVPGSLRDLTAILDDLELRVEKMRELAVHVVDEKEELLQAMCELQDTVDVKGVSDLDKEELKLTAERVMNRCLTVSVQVETPRTETQLAAWTAVNKSIDDLVAKSGDDPQATHSSAIACYNACLSEPPSGAIDYRFQGMILDCCAEDQKRVRRRLLQLIDDLKSVFGIKGGMDAYPPPSEVARQPYNPNKAVEKSKEMSIPKTKPLPSPDMYKDRDYLPSEGGSTSALGTVFNTTVS